MPKITQTPIKENDIKLDLIDHLNQDHRQELLAIATFYSKNNLISDAIVEDIFEEGILIRGTIQQKSTSFYIPFHIKGDLEEKVLYLAYYALTKQGKYLQGSKKQFFEITAKSMPSKNMMRIEFSCMNTLPDYYAGHTYGMVLKTLSSIQHQSSVSSKGLIQRLFDHFLMWLLRILNSQSRMKLIEKLNHDIRLYTLRKSTPLDKGYHGVMDIFLHENSPGSTWIKNLKKGDIILSRTEVEDKHHHLHTGKNILIGDETAFPAIAGILELWNNPTPPTVLILLKDFQDKHYFDHVLSPPNTEWHYLVYEGTQQSDKVISYLSKVQQLDGVWGGLEKEEARKVRHYIRHQFLINGANNHIKGYWVHKSM